MKIPYLGKFSFSRFRAKRAKIGFLDFYAKCQYPTQLLKILKIWFHIWIAGEMYFQIDEDIFFSISTPSPLKMGAKLGYIGPKNRVLFFLRKIESLVFARNGLKWSVLWLADFMRKCHIPKIYMQKLSTNQIARFFKLLYPLNRLSVFYNFLHEDRIP